MKLYSGNLSHYAGRCRMAIYAKGLSVEIERPVGGLKTPEYLALNPLGKMPCLVTDSGVAVTESEVILEYLEDAFPTPSLRPDSAEDKAKARLIARLGDLYVDTPTTGLWAQFDPAKRDPTAVEAMIAAMHKGLTWVEQHLGAGDYAVGDTLTTADCSLMPALFWVTVYAPVFDRPELETDHPRMMRYLETVRRHHAAAKVWDELDGAMAQYNATRSY